MRYNFKIDGKNIADIVFLTKGNVDNLSMSHTGILSPMSGRKVLVSSTALLLDHFSHTLINKSNIDAPCLTFVMITELAPKVLMCQAKGG